MTGTVMAALPSLRPRPPGLLALLSMLLAFLSFAAGQGQDGVEATLLRVTNETRALHGAPPLEFDSGLARAARAHADEMARLGYFAHESPVPDHATLGQRLTIAGVPSATFAENLAWLKGDFDVARTAVRSWLDSPGHREALLRSDLTHVGFGVAVGGDGAVYVAQVLARQPRELLSVAVVPLADGAVSVELRYEAGGGTLAAFVDGVHRRDALVADGTLRLVLAAAGTSSITVGEVRGDMMMPFDRFTLLGAGASPRLLAGGGLRRGN